MADWTIGRVLEFSVGHLQDKGFTDSPRLDAQLLLAHSLGLGRLDLYLRYDQPLNQDEREAFKALLRRRLTGEPVAYLVGRKGFWTLDLAVGPGVLIPRPDTETLVEAALDRLEPDSTARVLELGAGSGAIGLALASERPGLKLTFTDLSPQALDWARRNAVALGRAEEIEFLTGDLFAPLTGREFDMIVMNPPYVTEAEYAGLSREIADFEPPEALVAGADGLAVIDRLVDEAPDHLNPGGWLIFELGADQGPAVRDRLTKAGYQEVEIKPDLAGRDRVAVGRRPSR